MRTHLVLPVALGAALSALFAPAAHGATALVIHNPPFPGYAAYDNVVYRADPGEANDVTMFHGRDGTYTFEDRGAAIAAGQGCSSQGPSRVTCASTNALGTITLGDGNDRIAASVAPGTPRGAYSVYDVVIGGSGDDRIGLTATPGAAPPGTPGSDFTNRANFRGSFSVQGGNGDDEITGSDDDDILEGGRGRDRLLGGDGNDLLAGGRDDDALIGGRGADFLLGSDLDAFNFGRGQPPDRDSLSGEAGPDLLAGGPGGDLLAGGDDLDTLLYARELRTGRERPSRLTVTFDGRANDGPRGERDNVPRADVESAISVGSGGLSVAESVALKGDAYAIAGGRSARATIVMLSGRGTRASQSGTFYGASFNVRLRRLGGAPTEIAATGGSFRACGRSALRSGSAARTRRRLWGRGRGRFRTRGRHAAAVVRGTTWLTEDTCEGTRVRVVEGTVLVRDFGLRRNVLVRAGESYLARARA